MRNTYRHKSWLILSAAILAATWMVAGLEVLGRLNWPTKIIDLLTWMPAIMVVFWSISGKTKFLACERRAFKKLLGR